VTTTTNWLSDDRAPIMVSDDSALSCVSGSTAIDALRLALGSTLGAFIALAVVVAFVLLAKCQHRRRVRRRRRRRHSRRYSNKSQPLTDSDNLSFFDYCDDDYGSVFIEQKDDLLTTESALTSFPLQCNKTRPIFSDDFNVVVTDDCRHAVGRDWNVGDTSAQFYDDTETAATEIDRLRGAETVDGPLAATVSGQTAVETTVKSAAFDSGVAAPTIFVAGVADNDEDVGRIVSPEARCAVSHDMVDKSPSVRPTSAGVLRPPGSQTDPMGTAASNVDAMTTDCLDTTGLLSASAVTGRTQGGLKPNHYSSLW